jgi:hypothetical protein
MYRLARQERAVFFQEVRKINSADEAMVYVWQ